MTRGANPVVVDGAVRGTWRLDRDAVQLDCPEVPPAAAEAEVARLRALLRSP
jgi:hypothetical protein